jgi:hypothetical protein
LLYGGSSRNWDTGGEFDGHAGAELSGTDGSVEEAELDCY